MTLIAFVQAQPLPIFVGDVLLTRDLRTSETLDNKAHLPTGEVATVARRGRARTPAGLVQKLNQLNDQFVVAWCGNADRARRLINHLQWQCEDQGFTADTVTDFLNSTEVGERKGVELIVALMGVDNITLLFTPGVRQLHIEGIGHVLVAGSGTEHFIDDLRRTAKRAGPPQHGEQLVGIVSSAITSLIDREVSFGQSSTNEYGGAYEICIPNGNKFQKLDQFMLSHADLLFDSNITISPIAVLCSKYERSTLQISSISRQQDDKLVSFVVSVPPLWPVSEPLPPPRLDFASNIQIHHFRVFWKGEFVGSYTIADGSKDPSSARVKLEVVTASPQPGIQYKFKNDFINTVLKGASELISEKFPDAVIPTTWL